MPERMRPVPGERRDAEGVESKADPTVFEDLESLRNRLATAERQRDDYLALLQRTRADFENYQKHIQRDLAEERRHAHAPFARELLPVLDNLQRALEAARQHGEKGSLTQGVTLVESQLLEILRRFGITPIGARGEPFDPSLHEAVLHQPRSDVPPAIVAEVLESGYRLHERVLRPAKVVVSAPWKP